MKELFDAMSLEVSKLTTRTYSTSFSLGIYFLSRRIRNDIYAIYGFVRVADEIVDSFAGFDQQALLAKFKADTYASIREGASSNPILHAFQAVVSKYQMDTHLIDTFFNSMEMDLYQEVYNEEKYKRYILGSAEVVGLMCLEVFTEGNKAMYTELKPYAMKLGAAFQKVNFLRDLRSDYLVLGRQYFPGIDFYHFTPEAKSRIEEEIQQDFSEALCGIRKLPKTCRGGLYLAYNYYQTLFRKIKRLPARQIMTNRIRISNSHKVGLMIHCILENRMNLV
jgi:phytoene synthase